MPTTKVVKQPALPLASFIPQSIPKRSLVVSGLQPSIAAIAGSHYLDIYGDEVPARHRSSKWTLHRYFVPSPRKPESDDIASVIGDFLTVLERHADFVVRLAHEGHVSIWLQFNGAADHGIAVPPDLLRRMAALHIRFGIEVYEKAKRFFPFPSTGPCPSCPPPMPRVQPVPVFAVRYESGRRVAETF